MIHKESKKIAGPALVLALILAVFATPGRYSFGRIVEATPASVSESQLGSLKPGGEDPCTRQKANLTLAVRKPPTRQQYLDLVHEVSTTYGRKLDSDSRGELDSLLGGASRPGYGSDTGAILLTTGAGSAAIYTISWAARLDPADFLTANNLGVALKGAGDNDRALSVFLYAQQLEPDAPLTIDNTAWMDLRLGDVAAAKGLFEKAIKIEPNDEEALAGLGLLAQCRGDYSAARKYARQSLKQAFLPIAAAVLNSAEQGMQGENNQANDKTSPGKNSPPVTGGTGNWFDTDEPFENPHGKASTAGIELPDPLFSAKVGEVVASADQINNYNMEGDKEAERIGREIGSLGPALARNMSTRRSVNGTTMIYPRAYEKESFVLGDMRHIYLGRIEGSFQRFAGQVGQLEEKRNAETARIDQGSQEAQETSGITKGAEELDRLNADLGKVVDEFGRCIESAHTAASQQACTDKLDAQAKPLRQKLKTATDEIQNGTGTIGRQTCEAKKKLAERLHQQFYMAWQNYWTNLKHELGDYYGTSSPWIEDIHDNDLNQLENLIREQLIVTADIEQRQLLANWAIEMKLLWSDTCAPPSPPLKPTTAWKPLKNYPGDCHVPTWYVAGGPLTYEATCQSLKIEVGIKKIFSVSAEYKFGNDWGDDQLVIFGGLKAGKEIRGIKGAEFGAKVGGEIVVRPTTGEVIDYGLKATAALKMTVGPTGEGAVNPTGEVKVDARLGLKSPNGSFSAGTKFGLKGK